MDQVDPDSQGHLGSFAGAAGDNIRLVLEGGSEPSIASERMLRLGRMETDPEGGNTVLGLEGREAGLPRSSPG